MRKLLTCITKLLPNLLRIVAAIRLIKVHIHSWAYFLHHKIKSNAHRMFSSEAQHVAMLDLFNLADEFLAKENEYTGFQILTQDVVKS